MTEVISVKFKDKGKVYFFDPNGVTAKAGDSVIVETSKGLEFAECTYGNHEVEDSSLVPPLRPLIRVATEADIKRAEENKLREREAFAHCQKCIEKLGLEMKLVDVEYGFEGSKILFFFTADGRVDFRELVKELASVFKTRIELRQIGVRDEARMLGGLGICGRPFCCSSFLDEFHPVSIKMAKTQGLSLNPTKISGTCGRLMCCLKHEQIAYEDLVKKAPKVDSFVETPAGVGLVASVNLLRSYAKVRLEEGNDTTLKTFEFDELTVLGGKAKRAEYLAAKAEGRLEEAGFKDYSAHPVEEKSTFVGTLSNTSPADDADQKQQNRQKKQRPPKKHNPEQKKSAASEQKKQNPPEQNRQEPKKQEKKRPDKKQEPKKEQKKPVENSEEPKPEHKSQPKKHSQKPHQQKPREVSDDIKSIAEGAAREAAQKPHRRYHHRGGKPKQQNQSGENRQ